MHTHRLNRRTVAAVAAAAVLSVGAVATSSGSAAQTAPVRSSGSSATTAAPKPTIVLVHGAFADSSGWQAVADRLTKRGFPVIAFSNPLRGPVSDGEYLRQLLSTIKGNVVLVGHSYGGAVISNAATGNSNVKGLVYVAAYAPAEGESVAAANELGGGHTVVTDHLVLRPYPGAPEGDADAYIEPAWFHKLFAQDLPPKTTTFMAAAQRPGSLAALLTPSGEPAWKTIPSWYLVATQDRIIPPEAEHAMAKRAKSTTVVINSSHVAMMSHPAAVTALILKAAS